MRRGDVDSPTTTWVFFSHTLDWDAKKDTRTNLVTRALRGEEVGGRHAAKCWTWLTGLPLGIMRQSSFPLHEQSVVRVILVGLISNKTIRQSKQIVSRKPHNWLKGMHFNQFVPFRYVSTTFLQVGPLVRDKSWTGKHLSNGEHFSDLRYYIKWVTTF